VTAGGADRNLSASLAASDRRWCGPKPVRFFVSSAVGIVLAMSTTPFQKQLFVLSQGAKGTSVNDHVVLRTQEGQRVVCVDGLVVHHYTVGDSLAEAYAMVMLVESGYADQNDVARVFGYSTRTLRRNEERFASGGLPALGRAGGRPQGSPHDSQLDKVRDQTILRLKGQGASHRSVAKALGIDEKTVRKRLRRLGWKPSSRQGVLFGHAEPTAETAQDHQAPVQPVPAHQGGIDAPEHAPLGTSFDSDPSERTQDRFLAALGMLDDAVPLFSPAINVPRAGVLLAIPALVGSGVLSVAEAIYGSIGPAFYGLRTTITALLLFALLRIKRPESLKEYRPQDLGRILGLDRAPEVKTLRRKLERLAAQGCAERFGRELAQQRVAARGRILGFLYVDGHVRVYHGKHSIPKTHVTQMRISLPATTDYWVNDQRGDPLFVITADANAPLTRMLPVVLKEIRDVVGKKRRVTIVFDRGGFSPKLFAALIADGFDILTYRKGRFPQIDDKLFVHRTARLDGRPVAYRLHDQTVQLLKGQLRLRQVTRLADDGHQTPILTSRFDLRDIVVAYRMFERWRQENFFKYLADEFAIDALTDYQVEPDDPTRSVPNPAWKAADKELRDARAALKKLEEAYGQAALENSEGQRPTMRGFKIAHGKLGRQIRAARTRVAELKATRDGLAERVPVSAAVKGRPVVKLATERKHLTNVLKIVAYQIESDLLDQLRLHYARSEDEGRTLIQTALQSPATIEPTPSELRVVLAPLSSPHRSRAISALCEALNKTETRFPGTKLRLSYSVAGVTR
jgi:DNA-binding CsgD family transcriptional regulator